MSVDGVRVPDLAIASVYDDLAAPWAVLEALGCGRLSLGLGRIKTPGALCALSLIGPLPVRPLNDVPALTV
jgi:hypothetical protein